jgi:regulator of protease activity HflC (stomatin/prohibitin superfamily)
MKKLLGPLWAQFTGYFSDIAEAIGDWRQQRKTARQERAAAKEAADKTKRDAIAQANQEKADAAAKALRDKVARENATAQAKHDHAEREAAAKEAAKHAAREEKVRMREKRAKLGVTSKSLAFPITISSIILLIPVLIALLIGKQSGGLGGEYTINVLMVYGIIACIVFLLVPTFFVKIPKNHAVCVVISGKLVHYMCHVEDKAKLQERIKVLPAGHKLEGFDFDTLVTRESHVIWGLFVRFFNLHFKSWIPSTLKEIKIVRTRLDPAYTADSPISKMVTHSNGHSEELTPYLRLEFPRVIYLGDVELKGNVQVNLVLSVTGMCVLDLTEVFFVHTDVSTWIDLQLRQANINYLGTLTFEQFAEHDFMSNPANEFNLFMRDANPTKKARSSVLKLNSGISVIGVKIEGSASIADYELAESQELLRQAKVKREAAEVDLSTAELNAQAAATGITLEGKARALVEAEIIRQKGAADADARRLTGAAEAEAILLLKEAEAKGAEALAAAVNANSNVAQVLVSQAIAASNVTTYVQSTPGAPTPPVIIQPNP